MFRPDSNTATDSAQRSLSNHKGQLLSESVEKIDSALIMKPFCHHPPAYPVGALKDCAAGVHKQSIAILRQLP
jgi:hypothetical protein